MLAFYCGKCQALDEKGARAHRCASTKTVTTAPEIEEPVKLTPAERQRKFTKEPAI